MPLSFSALSLNKSRERGPGNTEHCTYTPHALPRTPRIPESCFLPFAKHWVSVRANCWCVSGAGGNTPTGAAGGTNVFARAVHHLCPSDPPLQPQVTLVALCDPFLPDLADASANPRWISPRRCDPCKTITLCGVSVCNSGQTALWASRGPSKLHDVHRWLQDTPAHNTVSGPPA